MKGHRIGAVGTFKEYFIKTVEKIGHSSAFNAGYVLR